MVQSPSAAPDATLREAGGWPSRTPHRAEPARRVSGPSEAQSPVAGATSALTDSMRTEILSPELVLKATPPRLGKGLLARPSLSLDAPAYRDKPVIVVQAPAGFGKTSLLGLWRREALSRGAVVAWLTLDERDEAMRFIQGLAVAMRMGSGRESFAVGLSGALSNGEDALGALTAWLAAVADLAVEVVLVLDDVHGLPETTLRHTLLYLLLNAPANLKVVLASRRRLGLATSELLARGELATVTAMTLHFRLEDTMALLAVRFGERIDADASAQLHERTEGWPLGLQLAIAAIEQNANLSEAVAALAAGTGDIQHYFVETLLNRLPAELGEFLVRVALTPITQPALCTALTGREDAAELLRTLREATPIFVEGVESRWLRIHPLAREFLLRRFELLPGAERQALYLRACRWLADNDLFEDATQLALSAGEHELACELAERCMYEIILRGQLGRVLEWFERLPATALAQRPRLRLAAAWALALGRRHQEARRLVAHIYDDAEADPDERCESAAVCSAAMLFVDEIDQGAAMLADWVVRTPPRSTKLQCFMANQQAHLCLYQGAPEQTRYHFLSAPRYDWSSGMDANRGFGEWLVGMSYLQEGQVRLAEGVLRASLGHAETVIGRRSQVAVMLATALAQALWEQDQSEAANSLLANRLDVVERFAAPEAIASAYVLRARYLALRGQEHRAYDQLDGLYSLGEVWRMPRLCIVSLSEQLRLHCVRQHGETCQALVRRLEAAAPASVKAGEGVWGGVMAVPYCLGQAYAALALREPEQMLDWLARAGAGAERLRRGRDVIQIKLLRALAMKHLGQNGQALFDEARSLADTLGLSRLVADTHPELVDWAGRRDGGASERRPAEPVAVPRPGLPRVAASALLTSKEGEVLKLLANNMSNKQIALALGVCDETIKWHLKNLFGKLSAGNRKHAVDRARMLGILDDAG